MRMPENPPNYTPYIATVNLNVPVCRLLQFIQMFQPCQNDLFAGLFDFTRKEDLVQNRIHLYDNEASSAVSDVTSPTAVLENAPYRS